MNGYRPMIINVAPTGAVPTKSAYAAVPITPDEIASDILSCADAGASVFHIHVRDEQGRAIHRRDLYERTIGLVRQERPELVLGVTTSSRVGAELSDRMIGLELDPSLRPDLASLSLGSFNFPTVVSNNPPDQIVALLERMGELGVGPGPDRGPTRRQHPARVDGVGPGVRR
jgi:3-keto-5-aminohexanoate cleavage enzyme